MINEAQQDVCNEGKDAERNRVLGLIVDTENKYPDIKIHPAWKELIELIDE